MKIAIVVSGKGGVGKSTICAALGITSALAYNKNVALMDADLCGPSLASLFPQNGHTILQSEKGWLPLQVDGLGTGTLSVMSLGYLLTSPSEAVIWRGPKKTAMLQQMLKGVAWDQNIDILLIDTPPGTSDELISLIQMLSNDHRFIGAIFVSTPQWVSLSDVKKEIEFCKASEVPILGIIENMRQVTCEHCGEQSSIFGSGEGVLSLANQYGIPVFGSVPLNCSALQNLSVEGSLVGRMVSSPDVISLFARILENITQVF